MVKLDSLESLKHWCQALKKALPTANPQGKVLLRWKLAQYEAQIALLTQQKTVLAISHTGSLASDPKTEFQSKLDNNLSFYRQDNLEQR